MAVRSWTRRAVVDLLSEFLTRSGRGQQSLLDELGGELGVEPFAVGALNVGYQVEHDGRVTLERVRFRFPYSLQARVPQAWRALVAAGLAEEADGGWRMTARGRDAVERLNARARAKVAALAVPAEPTRRAADVCEEVAARIPADSPRVAFARRIGLLPDERQADLVRLRRAVVQLWSRRDDCHIGAWQDAGYVGPELDVLSQVWEGRSTTEAVAKALENKQDRASVERNVAALVRRGDLEREGETLRLTPQGKAARDAIESDTDRRYFAGWPEGDTLARIGEDLQAVVDALA